MMSHNFGLLVEDFNSNYKEREFKDVVLKAAMDEEDLHKLCNTIHHQPLCYMCGKPNHQAIKCWHCKIENLDQTTNYVEK